MDPKQELINLLHDLSSNELTQVLDFIKSLQGKIHQEAFNFVLENYNETLHNLTDQEEE